MSFLFPQFLWGLLFLSIPIIIHFFSFRRVKVIEFSSIQFLKNINEETKNKRKVKQLLVLLARLLAIAFLVLAFAQPFFSNSNTSTTKTIIFLDNSYSMTGEIAVGQSAFSEAIVQIQELVKKTSINHQFKLITASDFRNNGSWKSGNQVLEKLSEVNLTNKTFDFESVISELREYEGSFQLIIFSDFQKNSFFNIDWKSLGYKTDLFPLQYVVSSNAFIDSVFLNNEVLLSEQQNSMTVNINNSGTDGINNLQLKVLDNDELVSTTTLNLEGSSSKSLNIMLEPKPEKDFNLSFELSDYPVVFDNQYFVSIPKYKLPNVVVVKNSEQEKSPFEDLFANKALFNLSSFALDDPNYEVLQNSEIVVLDQLDYIPEWAYSLQNADIALIPSSNNSENELSLLLGKQVRKESQVKSKLAIVDLEAPYFKGVFNNTNLENMDMPSSEIQWRVIGSDISLIENSFGVPYLSLNNSDNRKYFIASALEDDVTNFAKHALFVPVFYRIAQLSTLSDFKISNYINSDKIEVPFKISGEIETIKLVYGNQVVFPEYRVNSDGLILKLPEIDIEAGIYQLYADETIIGNVALNSLNKESNLDQIEADVLGSIAETSDQISLNSSNLDIQVQTGSITGYLSLWKISLMLSLFFIIVEVLLIRFLK